MDNLTSDAVKDGVDEDVELNEHQSASDQEEIWSDCAAELHPTATDRNTQKNTEYDAENCLLLKDSTCSVDDARTNLNCFAELGDKKANEETLRSAADGTTAESRIDVLTAVSKQSDSLAASHVSVSSAINMTSTDNKTGGTKSATEAAGSKPRDDDKTNDCFSAQLSTVSVDVDSVQKNIDHATETCSSPAQKFTSGYKNVDSTTESCSSKVVAGSKAMPMTTARTTLSSASTTASKNPPDCAKTKGCSSLPLCDSTFSVAQKNLDCATSTTSSSKSERPRASPCRAAVQAVKSVVKPPTTPSCKAAAAAAPCKAAAAAKQSPSSISNANAAAAKLLVDMVGRSKSTSCAGGPQCKLTQVCGI